MKKLILFLTLGLFLLSSCADNSNMTTGRDRTKTKSFNDIKQDRTITPTEKETEPVKTVEPTKTESTDDSKTFTVVLDGNESFWWVLVEFEDMKGNTLIMQDHPYLDLDELKEELKKDFKRPKDNPFILNFIQISKEMYIANSTKK